MRSIGLRFSGWRAPASTGSVRTPTGRTSIRPISSSIWTAPTIPRTGRSNWRCFMAGTTSTCITRSSGSRAGRACCCGRGCVRVGMRVRPGSSRSCATSSRRCVDGFRTRRFFCAATRGWRPRRSKPSWKRKASITCSESARIASSRPAWRPWSRRRRPGTSDTDDPCTSAPAFGTARRRGPILGGFSSRSTSPRSRWARRRARCSSPSTASPTSPGACTATRRAPIHSPKWSSCPSSATARTRTRSPIGASTRRCSRKRACTRPACTRWRCTCTRPATSTTTSGRSSRWRISRA